MNKKLVSLAALLLLVILAVALVSLLIQRKINPTTNISTFEECVQAGFAIEESYPRRCRDAKGLVFTEKVTPEPVPVLDEVTLEGEIVCLPLIDQSKAQEGECTLGFMTREGDYYDLRYTSSEQDIPVPGMRAKVTGGIQEGPLEDEDGANLDVTGFIEVYSLQEM